MKSLEKQQANIEFLLGVKEMAVKEVYNDITIVTYISNVRGEMKPMLQVFEGKKGNSSCNYYYNDFEQREEAIKRYKEKNDLYRIRKAKRAAERAAFKPELNVGDIYKSSWGHEQTNVDYYQVIEVKGTRTVVLRQIAQKQVEGSIYDHGMACEVVPVKDSFLNDETIEKRVGQYGINLTSYSSAYKWDGTPDYKSWYY